MSVAKEGQRRWLGLRIESRCDKWRPDAVPASLAVGEAPTRISFHQGDGCFAGGLNTRGLWTYAAPMKGWLSGHCGPRSRGGRFWIVRLSLALSGGPNVVIGRPSRPARAPE